jgi:hypothetical protein
VNPYPGESVVRTFGNKPVQKAYEGYLSREGVFGIVKGRGGLEAD